MAPERSANVILFHGRIHAIVIAWKGAELPLRCFLRAINLLGTL